MNLVISSDVRVATAGGEALFVDDLGATRSNDTGRSWLKLKAGDEVRLVASAEITDTYFAVVRLAVEGSDDRVEKGVIFRKDSWDKVLAASK